MITTKRQYSTFIKQKEDLDERAKNIWRTLDGKLDDELISISYDENNFSIVYRENKSVILCSYPLVMLFEKTKLLTNEGEIIETVQNK